MNTLTDKQTDRLSELVLARDLDTISDHDHQELEQTLRDSAAARKLYLQLCHDTAVLHGQAHEDVDDLLTPTQEPAPQKRSPIKIAVTLVSIGWVAAALVVAAFILGPENDNRNRVQIEDTAVAILAAAPHAIWNKTAKPPKIGSRIQPCILAIEEGYAQIEFYSGASVVLEGPATFELIDAQTGRLTNGRLHGQAPELAKGFTVHTPHGKVVDLGTAFGIDLHPNGTCEVHVMEGEVAVSTAQTTDHLLTAGAGVSFTQAGTITTIPCNPEAFLGPAQLAGILRSDAERHLAKWQSYTDRFRNSPDTIVYYDFQDQMPWERTIRNKAITNASEGSIIGAQWAEGRWPGKNAVELKQISDRIRLHIPGKFENATLATWIRFDSFDNWLSSLILTENWRNGESHWHVTWEGEAILGVGGDKNQVNYNYYTPAQVIDTNALGRWVHLVCVYDTDAKTVTQYVDGVEVGREPMAGVIPIVFGDAAIGNWSAIDKSKRDVRQIDGRIDEFLILSRAISHKEVVEMYNAGDPY